MLTISYFCTFRRSPTISNLVFVPKSPNFTLFFASMASSKVIAEYAKSNRSSCKKCKDKISAKALRLGLVSRDEERGFDMTKWHHLSCFPMKSDSVSSAEAIGGFSSLKSDDQEALKKLLDKSDQTSKKGRERDADKNEPTERTKKAKSEDQDALKKLLDESDQSSKKLSTPNEETKLEIAFSISDIRDKYKDAKLLPKWKAFKTIIFLERDDGLHDSKKIAAFDFDGCLAKTSVKKTGPKFWSLMYTSIPEKLQNLYNDGYKLVIFTNESNIERWTKKRQVAVDSKIGRLNDFIECVKVPIQVFIACGLGKSGGQAEDPFRKPQPGMWHIMEKHFNSGISIDMDQLFMSSLSSVHNVIWLLRSYLVWKLLLEANCSVGFHKQFTRDVWGQYSKTFWILLRVPICAFWILLRVPIADWHLTAPPFPNRALLVLDDNHCVDGDSIFK